MPALLDGFRDVVDDTYNLELQIVLVDDGSTDNTAEVANANAGELPIEVLRNEVNMGLSGTFVRGMVAASNKALPDDVIVCMDADNTHLPGQVLRMIRHIREGRDVVIASRYQPSAVVKGVPLVRRVLSRAMSILFRLVYPIPGVRDYSCGYRSYRAAFLKKVLNAQGPGLLAEQGFACMVGILLRLHKEGAVCGEVPIILRYDQKAGSSKMRVGRTIVRTLGVLLRERFTGKQ